MNEYGYNNCCFLEFSVLDERFHDGVRNSWQEIGYAFFSDFKYLKCKMHLITSYLSLNPFN